MTRANALPPGRPVRLPSPQLAALATIAATLSQSLSLDDTLEAALSEMLRATGAQSGGICLLDETDGDLGLRAQHGWSREFVHDLSTHSLSRTGLAHQVVVSNEPLVIDQLTGHEPVAVPRFHEEGFKSLAIAPMHARGRVTGVVSVMSGQVSAFDQDVVDLLCGIADTIGIALDNARLYETSVAAERRLNAVVAATTDGILATNAGGAIVLVNPAASRLLSLPAEQIVGQPIANAPLPVRLRLLVLSAMRTPGELRSRALRVALDEERVISAVVSPVFIDHVDGMREHEGWLLVLQDVSNLAETERARSAFLRAAAHDMRNPLSAAIQSLALVRRLVSATTPSLNDVLDIAQSGLSRVDQLIDDLLTLEMIQNRSQFSPELIDIGEFAFEIGAAARNRAEAHGLQVHITLGSAIPVVMADRRILELGVLQYVDNAIQHAPPDSELDLRLFRNGQYLHIEVADQGPGIPLEVQPRLFERFIPISLSDQAAPGIGLAIVKAAVDAHGGSVYVQSGEGPGSTFGLIIPLAPVAT